MYKIFIYFLCSIALLSCKENSQVIENQEKTLTILYTNDEHGWMEPTNDYGGAAGMTGLWAAREDYNGSDDFLVLSGGDMWTGPAISTWFQGESMSAVMNKMGYDAAAIGNHEFDFTTDVLNVRIQQLNFPLLAANIYEKGTENVPSFAKPYVIKETAGVKVGIIGLASQSTPYTSFPAYVADFDFTDYVAAVEKYAPIVQSEGADLIIIIGHICLNEMQALVPVAKKYAIPFIDGAHCHTSILLESDGVLLAQTNGELREYIKASFTFDGNSKTTTILAKERIPNNGSASDPEVESIVNHWQSEAEAALSEEIGYCSTNITQ